VERPAELPGQARPGPAMAARGPGPGAAEGMGPVPVHGWVPPAPAWMVVVMVVSFPPGRLQVGRPAGGAADPKVSAATQKHKIDNQSVEWKRKETGTCPAPSVTVTESKRAREAEISKRPAALSSSLLDVGSAHDPRRVQWTWHEGR
jgi:hypothetical protein